VTRDHTLMQRMIDAGELTPAEAEVHPHRSVLLRVLGTEPEVDLDVEDVGLLDGDRVILCSDGLTTMITEEQIGAIAAAAPGPQDAAERLVRAANRAGGIDNITVVLFEIVEGDPMPPDERAEADAALDEPDQPDEDTMEHTLQEPETPTPEPVSPKVSRFGAGKGKGGRWLALLAVLLVLGAAAFLVWWSIGR
jgi:PPM family protein phosphatase